MRIGIMGGTLDPVHNGHLEIAQAVRNACCLDAVMLLPAGDPPHKQRSADRMDRLEMAKLAALSRLGMVVSSMEVMREGTTFTIDTLRQLHREQPDVEWVYIIGADTVEVLDTWRDFAQVAQMCGFAAVGRPGFEETSVAQKAKELEQLYGAKIRLLGISGPQISSTDVRSAVARGQSIADMVPPEVEEYIRTHGLYLTRMSEGEIEDRLKSHLKPSRFVHTLGVADTAERLARRFGIDPCRARLAGLLHDCAKWMKYEDMVSLVKGTVSDVDEEELATEPVLHAPAGMVLAQREYGVEDPEILSAIRRHTLGGAHMTALEKLIYVADFIEPNRKPFDGLQQVRDTAETDLDEAARMCTRLTCEHVVRCGGIPNPRTLRMLEN